MNESSHAAKLLRAVWLGFTETLAWLPIPLCLAVWTLPAPAWYGWIALLPLLYAAGERTAARFARMRQLYRLTICAALGTASAYASFATPIDIGLASLVGAAFVYRGLTPIGPEDARQVREVLLPSLLLYFFVSVAAGFIDRFDGFRLLLTAGGVCTLLLTIRRANRITLIDANLGGAGRGVPRSVMLRNRTLIVLFTAAAACVVLFRQLEALWRSFVRWVNGMFAGMGSGERPVPEEDALPDLPAQDGMLPLEGEPSPIWVILDYVVMAFGFAVIAVLLWLALRSLSRIPLLAKLFAKWLAAWRARKPAVGAGGYEDEVESLAGPSPLNAAFRRLRSLVSRGESWASLTPEEQIRYLFRRRFKEAGKQGYAYRPHLTPSENMKALRAADVRPRDGDARLTEAYEGVRYGGRAAAKEEAAGLRSKLDL